MKCPLRFMGCEIDALKPPETRFLCLKEECGRWSKEFEQCSDPAIAGVLGVIANLLTQLIDKMPHEAQFRK